MSEDLLVWYAIYFKLFVSFVVVVVLLFFQTVPMGKLHRGGWGFELPGKPAWVIFELFPLLSFHFFYWYPVSESSLNPTSLIILGMFTLHYVQRVFIYPLTAPSIAPVSIGLILSACMLNTVNGYMNGRSHGPLNTYTGDEIREPYVWVGMATFLWGFLSNIYCDQLMFYLRRKAIERYNDSKKGDKANVDVSDLVIGPTGSIYVIPTGYLYEYVSCAPYFAECVEWLGWAIASQRPSAFTFSIFVFANLVPRAISSHKWYLQKFGEKYPKNRKAVIPFLL
ncbi:Steroid 5-alpha-reductase det2 [Nowakowskiella sp. JEL0407]|nr:Steroid 5-alpha-reductase det2 [Nowakowskiella sp. JEL0407]